MANNNAEVVADCSTHEFFHILVNFSANSRVQVSKQNYVFPSKSDNERTFELSELL